MLKSDLIQSTSSWPFVEIRKLLKDRKDIINKKNKINEIYKRASGKDILQIKRFKTLKNLRFIEFPKLGIRELSKIVKKISKLEGGLRIISSQPRRLDQAMRAP